jgi:hypothetical protein
MNLTNETPCVYTNLTNETLCVCVYIYINLSNETPCIYMNLTDTHAEPGVPLVALTLTRTGDVPAVQRDGHEVSVVGAAEFALAFS